MYIDMCWLLSLVYLLSLLLLLMLYPFQMLTIIMIIRTLLTAHLNSSEQVTRRFANQEILILSRPLFLSTLPCIMFCRSANYSSFRFLIISNNGWHHFLSSTALFVTFAYLIFGVRQISFARNLSTHIKDQTIDFLL